MPTSAITAENEDSATTHFRDEAAVRVCDLQDVASALVNYIAVEIDVSCIYNHGNVSPWASPAQAVGGRQGLKDKKVTHMPWPFRAWEM